MIRSAAALAVLLAAPATAATAATIVNGSFESPGAGSIFFPGQTGLTGWTILDTGATGSSVDYVTDLTWIADTGDWSIDLSGNARGGVAQEIADLVPGTVYDIRFALSGNPVAGSAIKQVTVSAAGQSQTFSYDVTGQSLPIVDWQAEVFRFTAAGPSATLAFTSLEDSVAGPAIDSVSIAAAVPLPVPALLLLTGLAGLGLAARRRG